MVLRHNPGKCFIETFGPVKNSDDVTHYAQFLRKEAGLESNPPVDLSQIYEHFGIPKPSQVPLGNIQGLLLNSELGIILVNCDDPLVRQRFTEAHELMEMLFSALETHLGKRGQRIGGFKKKIKETLCDEGAAELLMPQVTFASRVSCLGASYQTARKLAVEYQVSTSAVLVRIARISPGRHAAVLWRMKNKPSELRNEISNNQLSFFDDISRLPPKKLRVEWAKTSKNFFIPMDKSVPTDSSIYKAWESGSFTVGEDNLDFGSVNGTFHSENQPFENNGERYVHSLVSWRGKQ